MDQAAPPAAHSHDDDGIGVDAAGDQDGAGATPGGLPSPGPGEARLAGRTRQSKLVHLVGSPDLVGRLVHVRVEHAGPFSLRGRLA